MKYLSILTGILAVLVVTSFFYKGSFRQDLPEVGVVKNNFVENVDGVDHLVNIYYGRVGIKSLNQTLKDRAISVVPEDRVKVLPDPSLGLGSRIIVRRATPILVSDGGVKNTYYTWSPTVDDFLVEKNIALGESDRLEPARKTRLMANLELKITRVKVTEIKEQEAIAYLTVVRDDSDLPRGQSRIEQTGHIGLREKTYRVTRENSQEISRELLKNEVVNKPINKIVYHGTKVVILGEGLATWYGLIGGMTAASNELPYGTMVHVVNLGNGRSVDVRIVDHGIQGRAIIDLSDDAFRLLASLGQGTIWVRLERP